MQFYYNVRDRLGERISGFDYIFDYLQKIENPTIVETGCARLFDNYTGDGQSSLLFDEYINEYGGTFTTIDLSEESVNFCKSMIKSSNSEVILGDSIKTLHELCKKYLELGKTIDLLYLDSFDAPRDNPQVLFNSSLHHLYELLTINKVLSPNCLICVDDNWIENGVFDGKGRFIFDYFSKLNNDPVLLNYQFLWNMK